MNATDCARATEPHSTTARHKARPKLTARRPTCGGCGTSANIARILARAYHPYRFRGRSAVRVVTCGAPATAGKLKSDVLPPTRPRIRQPRRHCFRIDIFEAAAWRGQAVQADFHRASFPDRESDEICGRRRDGLLSWPSLRSPRVASPARSAPTKEAARCAAA